jgi:hypothetical protein
MNPQLAGWISLIVPLLPSVGFLLGFLFHRIFSKGVDIRIAKLHIRVVPSL